MTDLFPQEPEDRRPFDPHARPKFERQELQKAPSVRVPWFGLTFTEIDGTNLMDRLREHILALPIDKRRAYALYLTNFCKFPSGFFRQYLPQEGA
jgi:hypothetical protein